MKVLPHILVDWLLILLVAAFLLWLAQGCATVHKQDVQLAKVEITDNGTSAKWLDLLGAFSIGYLIGEYINGQDHGTTTQPNR